MAATTHSQALELCDRLRQVLVIDTSLGVVNLLDQVIAFLETEISPPLRPSMMALDEYTTTIRTSIDPID
jgi:hypothetical protein